MLSRGGRGASFNKNPVFWGVGGCEAAQTRVTSALADKASGAEGDAGGGSVPSFVNEFF